MRYPKRNTLYCFSPPVMIATFLIEIAGAAWVTWRGRLDKVTRLIVTILILLAIFQMAEFAICENALIFSTIAWARIGFIAITLLPPLGIHLAFRLANAMTRKGVKSIVSAGYMIAICFALYFLYAPGFTESKCFGNYVIFALSHDVTYAYSVYYYGLLIGCVAICLDLARKAKKAAIKKPLHGLAMGYLLFMIPTTAANLIAPQTLAAIPSVMCGFAVILAIMLVGIVLPGYQDTKIPRIKRGI